jgi:hypothetical protein
MLLAQPLALKIGNKRRESGGYRIILVFICREFNMSKITQLARFFSIIISYENRFKLTVSLFVENNKNLQTVKSNKIAVSTYTNTMQHFQTVDSDDNVLF